MSPRAERSADSRDHPVEGGLSPRSEELSPRVANGCRTSIAQPTSRRSPSQPRARRPRVETQPMRVVPLSERRTGSSRNRERRRNLGQAGDRPGAGTGACRRVHDRPGSPPRGPRGDDGDRAWRDSRAWLGRLAPNDGRDGPGRTAAHSPGSGSRGPGGAARAAAPGESSGSGPRFPQHAHPDHVASPPGLRRRPSVETFPRKRARRLREPIGPVDPGPRARVRRREPRPGNALPVRRDRARDGEPFRE